MIKFVIKASLFIVPFVLLTTIKKLYNNPKQPGDFYRIGSVPYLDRTYRNNFNLDGEIKFEFLSQTQRKTFDILTIGDSFSEQHAFGYKNQLANYYSVLHVDRFISRDPYQTLVELLNGDFFDNYDIGTVILQGVERHVMDPVGRIDLSRKLDLELIDSMVQWRPTYTSNKSKHYNIELFSRESIKFPLYDLPRFLCAENYYINDMVGVASLKNTKFFSNESNQLIFLRLDQHVIQRNSSIKNIEALNDILSFISIQLAKRGVKLIFLPAPDKFSFYFDYLQDQTNYRKPGFFESMQKTQKNYTFINTNQVLKSFIETVPDLYFYDDSHWSPVASKIIAEEIVRMIELF
jgi:hypothetical protein